MDLNSENNISKYLSGEMSMEELEVFMTELDNSEELQKEVEAYSKIYRQRIKPNFNSFKNQVEKQPRVVSIAPHKVSKWKIQLGLVAGVALFVALGVWQFFREDNVTNSQSLLAFSTELTSKEFILPDGSTVTLNKNSKLIFDKESTIERRITLEGEAFFEVAKDKNHPFVITTNSAQVTVLGTSFSVNTTDVDSLVVLVETGKVNLASIKDNTQQINLVKGQKGALSKKSFNIKKSLNLAVSHLYWKDKTIIFRKTKMKKVVETLNQIYDTNIQLKNEELNNCIISAKFQNDSVENILNVIGATFNFTIQKENNQFFVDGKGC